jgi:hypothetical protein
MVKRVLKRIGNFQELGYDDDPSAPTLAAARGKRPRVHKADVVGYLNSGKTFVFSPGIDQDVFDDRRHADSCSIVTDGTFAWQKQIAYYVDNYDIELPEEFEAHMRANAWRIPEAIDLTSLEMPRRART